MRATCLGLLLLLAASTAQAAGWVRPFDGKSLNNWKTVGAAEWRAERGELIGRQGAAGAAGDIFTTQQWKDVEIEAEWRMTFPGNSGLWFRWAGPKTGCQADFLENEPAFPGVLSGSVYCMGTQFVGVNKDPSAVNKSGWNKIRIRAVGEEITVILNGRQVVKTRSTTQNAPGSIGLQVHAGKQFEGMEVRLRNLRVRIINPGKGTRLK